MSRPRRQKYSRMLGPAVRLALRAPQPKESHTLAKTPSKDPLLLVPETAWEGVRRWWGGGKMGGWAVA